jgi:hypothetical protein
MRRTMTLLLAVGLLAVAAFGVVGSAAWFTDDAAVPISATGARLDIQALVGTPCGSMAAYDPSGVTIDVEYVAPGAMTDPIRIDVYNRNWDGELPVKYRYTASKTSSDPGFWAALQVKVQHGFPVGDCDPWPLGFSHPYTVYNGPLSGLNFDNGSSIGGGGLLPPNTTRVYSFEFYLEPSAGNDLQGGNATFDIVIDATQDENPGW